MPKATWHAIRTHFGITAFGVGASEAAAGDALIWPHTERHYGHEELYLVLQVRALPLRRRRRGRARRWTPP
jgi:hypothetical protein